MSKRKSNVLHTKRGDYQLARESSLKKAKKIVAQIQRTTDALTRHDIADWRGAWQWAINVDNPNRQRLYDIYRDCEVDAHLTGCVAQRQGFVLAKSFKIQDQQGTEHDDLAHYFRQEWFRELCRLCLDSVMWGYSLIELGEVVTDGDGCPCYSGVRLIPRKHVYPEYHRVVQDVGMDWRTGIDYHEQPFSSWLIEAGQPDSLGLYLKAAQHTIPKKNMLAFWDTFGEIFGMPMRIAHTTLRDEKELKSVEGMMDGMASKFWAVLPEGTEVQVVESTKGDAYNVYDKRIDRANSEISKLIIGQTMTIENGSSLSQSQTHLEVFENLVESDAALLADVVNNQLLPRMVKNGFPLQGMRFAWDDSVDYTPEQQHSFEEMLLQHFDVAPKYFTDKYGVPCATKRDTEPDDKPDGGEPSGNEPDVKKRQDNARPFFD